MNGNWNGINFIWNFISVLSLMMFEGGLIGSLIYSGRIETGMTL